jgi:acetyl esterase/lipase
VEHQVVWTTEALTAWFPELSRIDVEPVVIDGPNGDVDARVYRSPDPVAVLVWVHGGAFAFGDLDMPEAHWVSLALAARGITTLSVEYRKSIGGVHHPVPGDDVLAAWRWADANRALIAFDGAALHLGGASAGGCLTAATAKRLRDADEVPPASLVLVYPVAHAVLPEPSDELRATLAQAPPEAVMFDDASTLSVALNYVGDERAFGDPYAFPANGDHTGMPATLIVNAEYDRLRASGEAFGAALGASGVDVQVVTEPGTAHGHINEPALAEAHRTVDRMAAWIKARS